MREEPGAGFDALILGSLVSGVVAIDVVGRVVSLNAGAQRILACPEGDRAAVIGRDCRDVLAPQPLVVRLLLETLERKSPISRAELQLSGSGATTGFTLCPVMGENGTPCGAAMLFRDLAPIEHADEQERLRERLAALGQMAADLAHELRNPLAGIEVAAGLLKRRLGDRPDERELVDEITGEVRSLAETVSAGLAFVRPETPVTCPVDPVQLLEEALARSLARIPFSGAVERRWPDALPELRADPDQLRTLLVNLLVNALEALQEGGGNRLRVAVRAQPARATSLYVDRGGEASKAPPDEWEIVFSVCDDGPGIAAELREKVFYPFFTTREGGSGVGLASAQKIAASHGGCLELAPGLDGGCAFHLRLPAHGVQR
jgi:signal transduction histidine kinase